MGDPRKRRKKYSTPKHPWNKERIDAEKAIKREYGVANKKEIWKMESILKSYSSQAKEIIKMGKDGEKEAEKFIKKLANLSILTPNSTIDDVLGLKLDDLMERRLQTLVFRKKLAKSIKQARQFIVHRHIKVSGKVITSPSYIVKKDEEETIEFVENSPLLNPEHPERKESKKEDNRIESNKMESMDKGKDDKKNEEKINGENKESEEKENNGKEKDKIENQKKSEKEQK